MPPKKYPVASTSVPSVQRSETPEIILPSDPIPEHETHESEAPEELRQSLLEAETTATLTEAIMLMTKNSVDVRIPPAKRKPRNPTRLTVLIRRSLTTSFFYATFISVAALLIPTIPLRSTSPYPISEGWLLNILS